MWNRHFLIFLLIFGEHLKNERFVRTGKSNLLEYKQMRLFGENLLYTWLEMPKEMLSMYLNSQVENYNIYQEL